MNQFFENSGCVAAVQEFQASLLSSLKEHLNPRL